MKVFLVLCFLVVSLYASPLDDWASFKQTHGKKYMDPSEEHYRMNVFFKNKAFIEEHNKNYENGQATFHVKMNHFGDLTFDEFRSLFGVNGSESENDTGGSTFLAPGNAEIPESIDWRQKGAVTPVKSQGHCGSCWAFSVIGSLEGQMYKKTGKLVSLSEQNLIDCAGNGCKATPRGAGFNYIKRNGGIDTEDSYPYEAREGKCRFNKATVGGTVSSYVRIREGDEEELKKAVATVGPVSVSITCIHPPLQFYSGGVYYENRLSSSNDKANEMHHAVVVVGYGSEKGHDYWIVKNSYGAGWGDHGYTLMARNKGNQCSIANRALYPVV